VGLPRLSAKAGAVADNILTTGSDTVSLQAGLTAAHRRINALTFCRFYRVKKPTNAVWTINAILRESVSQISEVRRRYPNFVDTFKAPTVRGKHRLIRGRSLKR
jgi:hypothetical protein